MFYEQHGSVPVLVKDRISKYSNLPYLHAGPFLPGFEIRTSRFFSSCCAGVGGGGWGRRACFLLSNV
jgi:hypothetical protein